MKLPYELNHLYKILAENAAIAAGEGYRDQTYEQLELFDKSLALSSDLKRLPIMRGEAVVSYLSPSIIANMTDSNVAVVSFLIEIYNGAYSVDNPPPLDDLIMSKQILVHFDDLTTSGSDQFSVHVDESPWDFEGGILLSDTVTLYLDTRCNTTVTTEDFPAGVIRAIAILEMDWFPIGKKDFQDYILESVYAEKLNV